MQQKQIPSVELPADIDDNIRILQLVTGVVDGSAFWAYIAMYPSRFHDYAAQVDAGQTMDLSEYGEIIADGPGDHPPQHVQERMAKEYGAQPDFEAQLLRTLNQENDL